MPAITSSDSDHGQCINSRPPSIAGRPLPANNPPGKTLERCVIIHSMSGNRGATRKAITDIIVTPGPVPSSPSKYYTKETVGTPGYGDAIHAEAIALYFAGKSSQQVATIITEKHDIDPPLSRRTVWAWIARYRDQQALRSEAMEPALYERVQRLINKLLDEEEAAPGTMHPKDLAYLLGVAAGSIQKRHHMYIESRNARTAEKAVLPVPGHIIDAEWSGLEPDVFPALPAALSVDSDSEDNDAEFA